MKITMVLLLTIVALGACERRSVPADRMCTEEYRFLNVKLRSVSGETVKLDTFYTRIVGSNVTFHANNTIPDAGNGYYAVVTDGQLQLLPEQKNTELRFIGIKNDKTIVNEPYMVKNNGCHIEKISGKTEVVVQ
ncbi:hypothetical protein [Niabella beijingensis]|uniref:hypothetical protein n=1 Tax=Niabella beijingensis TaxID=2872700 RepID=UPI001CC14F73|nr:hypothetical protein [Niabella beijingensis]MBZ4188653.1 hypothetical protein [Niabella beijingensis]